MKKGFKNFFSTILEKQGYTILPNWRVEQLALELHLKKLFLHYGIDVVIDVGANNGQYRNFLRERVQFAGIVHSFEPLPALAARMTEQARSDPHWHVHNCGLGSENQVLPLNIMARDTFSSFREPNASAPSQFQSSTAITSTVMVPVHRLDEIAPSMAGVPDGRIYLKTDTQGFDLDVLNGATSLFPRVMGLQFELALQRIYLGVPHYLDMLRITNDLGYDISGLFPVSSDDDLRAVELDCVMVRHPQSAK